MYREIRRKDRVLSEEEMFRILEVVPYGVLSTVGEDGMPYGTPISFVYKEGAIFFHSAIEGHKLDNIKANSQVSFCIVTDVAALPDKFSTNYKSVIAFGKVEEVTGEKKAEAFKLFLEKFSSDFMESGMEYINTAGPKARVFRINIDHMTAKGRV